VEVSLISILSFFIFFLPLNFFGRLRLSYLLIVIFSNFAFSDSESDDSNSSLFFSSSLSASLFFSSFSARSI